MIRRIVAVAVLLPTAAACSAAPTTASQPGPGAASAPGATAPPPPGSGSTAPAAGAVKYYDCAKLLSQGEVQQATGLSNARFSSEDKNGPYKGQTYCQFFGGKSDSIAVSVLTGPSYTKVFQPLASFGQSLSPAVGDWATWSAQGNTLGVRLGSTGVTIVFQNTGSGALGISDPKGAAISMAKLVLSRL